MPIVYDPSSYLVTLNWTGPMFASGGAATVLGFNGPASTVETVEDLGSAVLQAWLDELRGQQDNNIVLSSIRVEGDNESVEVEAAFAASGSIEGPPSNTALIRYKKGPLKGRRNAGRNFWPGFLAENQVDERGNIQPARLTALGTAFNAFIGEITGSVLGDWVESIPQAETPESTTPPYLPWPEVVTSGVRPIIGTQRRRVRR